MAAKSLWNTGMRFKNKRYRMLKRVLISAVFFFVIIALAPFMQLIYYESQLYTDDTLIFWAIGRGITNGFLPYSDFFETKPPGIYYLSAISFYVFGSPFLMHLVNALSFVFIGIAPLLFLILYWKNAGKQIFLDMGTYIQALLSLFFGIALAFYFSKNAGSLFAEPVAVFFIMLYILLFSFLGDSRKVPLAASFAAGLLILAAAGTKEPFIFVAICCALILSRNFGQMIGMLFIPIGIAAGLGAILLLILGIFDYFFSFYLPFMLTHRIHVAALPILERWVEIIRLAENLSDFSIFFLFLIILLFVAYSVVEFRKASGRRHGYAFTYVKLFFLFVSFIFSFAISGPYFSTHFAAPAPIYSSLLIFFSLHFIGKTRKRVAFALIIMALSIFSFLPNSDMSSYQDRLIFQKENEKVGYAIAGYVDTVLYAENIDRYLFIGYNDAFNFPRLYGLTRHSPYGPVFNQDMGWIELSNFSEEFFLRLDEAELVVFEIISESMEKYGERINSTLAEEFTLVPWESVSHIPMAENNRYKIYFKKR